MSYTAKKLIEIAKNEVGYLEKESNNNLDDKTANAGDENYTKYARDLREAGYYNGNKNGYAWCDVFVDWCFYQLCGKDAVKAQEMTCQTGVYGAGCKWSAKYYKAQSRLKDKPEPGDQIFFFDEGRTSVSHTGIVSAVDNRYVYTMEGNTRETSGVVANGGGVFEKKYLLTYNRIYGYGRPKYDEVEEKTTSPQKTEVKTVSITLDQLKIGHKGEQVKTLQTLLKAKGYKGSNKKVLTLDGDFGANTLYAVKKCQATYGISVDGIVGKDTWTCLLTK